MNRLQVPQIIIIVDVKASGRLRWTASVGLCIITDQRNEQIIQEIINNNNNNMNVNTQQNEQTDERSI